MPDFTKTYFEAFRKIGVSTDLFLMRMKGDQLIETHKYEHADYDGVSSIVDLAKNTLQTSGLHNLKYSLGQR